MALAAGSSRAFTSVISLGAAGAWDTPLPSIAKVLQPYANFFAKQYGTKPAYCPSGAINAGFEQNEKNFNRHFQGGITSHDGGGD